MKIFINKSHFINNNCIYTYVIILFIFYLNNHDSYINLRLYYISITFFYTLIGLTQTNINFLKRNNIIFFLILILKTLYRIHHIESKKESHMHLEYSH
jgi:hypothetical protein